MYGKYSPEKFEKTKKTYKRWGVADKDGIIKTEALILLYSQFIENMDALMRVFPYKSIPVDQIREAEEGRVWTWSTAEERERVIREIGDFGMFFPLIVLDKWIENNGNPASKYYNVLDGNHRVSAIRSLGIQNIDAFIFPEDCIDIRHRMLGDYKRKRNIIEPLEINVIQTAVSKMNIEWLKTVPFRRITEKVTFTDRLEAYNGAMSIAHELTPFLYQYIDKYNDYPEGIKSMAYRVIK